MRSPRRAEWSVDRTWDGMPVGVDERASVTLLLDDDTLRVEVDAPFHHDPTPPGPAGSFDGLWAFEVVELFLLGVDGRYIEIELSPHGHHLVLSLHGARRRVGEPLPATAFSLRSHVRWHGTVEMEAALLPDGVGMANAYAIHGQDTQRRYLAAHPPGGDAPDFHRLAAFQPIAWLEDGGA